MEIDLMTDRAHSARVYDHFLGGKTNYAADREAADAIAEALPSIRDVSRNQRAFMQRTARFVAEQGVTQFLDIGTGIPTEPNLHQVVQEVAPAARVVYVDNDPIVLAHAAALMTGTPEGRVSYIQADVTDPRAVIDSEELIETLDLTRPVGVSIIGILHFLEDDQLDPVIDTLMGAVPSGSYLTINQGTYDNDDGSIRRAGEAYVASGIRIHGRSIDRVRALLHGLEIVEPGIVVVPDWRPQIGTANPRAQMDRSQWAAVARKP